MSFVTNISPLIRPRLVISRSYGYTGFRPSFRSHQLQCSSQIHVRGPSTVQRRTIIHDSSAVEVAQVSKIQEEQVEQSTINDETSVKLVDTPAVPLEDTKVVEADKSATTASQDSITTSLSDRLRKYMRSVPYPIAIITVSEDQGELKPDDFSECFGVTISSLTPVTLGPPAMISFNLRRPSRTLDAINKVSNFRVSFLRNEPPSTLVAKAFLEHAHSDAFKAINEAKPKGAVNAMMYCGPLALEDDHQPYAPRFDLSLAAFSLNCAILKDKCVEVGDHTIVVARVFQTTRMASKLLQPASVLLYRQGQFAKAAELINRQQSSSEQPKSLQSGELRLRKGNHGAGSPGFRASPNGEFYKLFSVATPQSRSTLPNPENSGSISKTDPVAPASSSSPESSITVKVVAGSDTTFPTFYLEDKPEKKKSK